MTRRTVYGILDANARAWWWCRELRRRGDAREARRRERHSIRSLANSLRLARENGWLELRPYGAALCYPTPDGYATVEGINQDLYSELAERLKIPTIDTRPIPGAKRYLVLRVPYIRYPGRDEAYGGASLTEVAHQLAALGAVVRDIPAVAS